MIPDVRVRLSFVMLFLTLALWLMVTGARAATPVRFGAESSAHASAPGHRGQGAASGSSTEGVRPVLAR